MSLKKKLASIEAKRRAIAKQLNALSRQTQDIIDVHTGYKASPEQARKIASQKFSFTVHFVRREILRQVRSPGKVCKSQRRFSSPKEAEQHGKRFKRIQRHLSYSVVRVAKRANAWINWRTGKTNPVLNG